MAFEDWNEKKKMLVTTIIGGIVVVLVWSVFIWRFSIVVAKKRELADANDEKAQKEEAKKQSNQDELKKTMQKIEEEFKKKEKYIPPEEEVQTVFLSRDLDSVIRQSALGSTQRLSLGKTSPVNIPGARGKIRPIERMKIHLSAQGTYDDALQFLNRIEEHFPRVVEVDKLALKVNSKQSKPDKTVLDLDFDLYVYFYKGGENKRKRRRRKSH